MTIEENTDSSEKLFVKTQEMTAQSIQANGRLLESLNAIGEVMNVIQQVESSVEHLNQMNNQAANTIGDNLQTILSVVQVIEEIQEASQATKEYMGILNKVTAEISHILDTVSYILRQTRLLALNASIESARVGEAGKGFAVVAEEVRGLSDHTSNAVQDVSQLIDTMKTSIGNVNTYIDLNAKKVEEGVTLSLPIRGEEGHIIGVIGMDVKVG